MATQHSSKSATSMHSTFLFAAEVLITSITLGFTNPASTLRRATLPFVMLCVGAVIQSLRSGPAPPPKWTGSLASSSILMLFQHIDVVFLNPRSYSAGNDNASPAIRRLLYGLHEATSLRHINTPEQVKNVPPYPTRVSNGVPTRHAFMRHVLVRITICAFFIDVADIFGPSPAETLRTFPADKIPLLTRLENMSSEALGKRLESTLGFFALMYCAAYLTWYPFALITVALDIESPGSWRPYFNSPFAARSIRLFWG
ncbi:MAG: hypothetical protein Q9162_003010 [Coniocarpon cinnabarinum]